MRAGRWARRFLSGINIWTTRGSVDGQHDLQRGSYLGPGYSGEEIEAFLKEKAAPYERLEGDDIHARVADLIASEKVIGYVQGRMEFGPRALGRGWQRIEVVAPHHLGRQLPALEHLDQVEWANGLRHARRPSAALNGEKSWYSPSVATTRLVPSQLGVTPRMPITSPTMIRRKVSRMSFLRLRNVRRNLCRALCPDPLVSTPLSPAVPSAAHAPRSPRKSPTGPSSRGCLYF